jgi:alpha-tubulin suppressor-like RCC1 family protein
LKKKFVSLIIILTIILTPFSHSQAYANTTTIKIGDYILFGRYNDEPILWRVIGDSGNPEARLGDKIKGDPLLLSDRILTLKSFDPDYSNFWAGSTLRAWLNSDKQEGSGERYEKAYKEKGFLADGNFTEAERRVIKPVTQKTLLSISDIQFRKDLNFQGTEPHEDIEILEEGAVANYDNAYSHEVTDEVFILDIKQFLQMTKTLGGYNRARPTEKCVEKSGPKYFGGYYSPTGEFVKNEIVPYDLWYYWLRTPAALDPGMVRYVDCKSGFFKFFTVRIYSVSSTRDEIGVRPALYLDSKLVTFESGKGTYMYPFVVSGGVPYNEKPKIKLSVKIRPTIGLQYAIKNDNSLWFWGDYLSKNNDLVLDGKPIKVADNVVSVAGNNFQTYILKNDGSLWANGTNEYGQLGIGKKVEYDEKSEVPILKRYKNIKIADNVVYVEANNSRTFIIKADGSLWGCGDNSSGQLGIGEYAEGEYGKAYNDGVCEKYNKWIKVMDDVVAVKTSDWFTLILKSDGTLWGTGFDDSGQLGDGGNVGDWFRVAMSPAGPEYYLFRMSPIKIMDDVVDIAVGDNHALAIKADGSLWSWGDNSYGQLGLGVLETSIEIRNGVPNKVMDNVVAVAAVGNYSIALTKSGEVYQWGGSPDRTEEYICKPVKVMDNVVSIGPFVALKKDGTVWEWSSRVPKLVMSGVKLYGSLPQIGANKSIMASGASAVPTQSKVIVDNKEIPFEAFNIGGYNYFKLRDIAMALRDSDKRFEVKWDASKNAISIITNNAYTPEGSELKVSGNKATLKAYSTSSKIYVDGKEVQFIAYNIDGYNYFKLRDIGKALNFGVFWDGSNNAIKIDTSKDYKD